MADGIRWGYCVLVGYLMVSCGLLAVCGGKGWRRVFLHVVEAPGNGAGKYSGGVRSLHGWEVL